MSGNLASTLARRGRGRPMDRYDRLPAELRRWLAGAALPWSAGSALRLWRRLDRETGGDVARMLQPQAADSPLARLTGLVVCFIVTLLAWRLLAWLLQQLIQASPLAPLDRLLGAGFGLLRGVLVLWALAMMLSLTPLARQDAWQVSSGIGWIAKVHGWLAPWLPGDWGPAGVSPPAEPAAPVS